MADIDDSFSEHSPFEQGEVKSSPELMVSSLTHSRRKVVLVSESSQSVGHHHHHHTCAEMAKEEIDIIEIPSDEGDAEREALNIKPPQSQAGPVHREKAGKHKVKRKSERRHEKAKPSKDKDRGKHDWGFHQVAEGFPLERPDRKSRNEKRQIKDARDIVRERKEKRIKEARLEELRSTRGEDIDRELVRRVADVSTGDVRIKEERGFYNDGKAHGSDMYRLGKFIGKASRRVNKDPDIQKEMLVDVKDLTRRAIWADGGVSVMAYRKEKGVQRVDGGVSKLSRRNIKKHRDNRETRMDEEHKRKESQKERERLENMERERQRERRLREEREGADRQRRKEEDRRTQQRERDIDDCKADGNVPAKDLYGTRVDRDRSELREADRDEGSDTSLSSKRQGGHAARSTSDNRSDDPVLDSIVDSPFRDILRRVGIIGSNSPSPVRDSHDDGTALKSQSPDLEDGDRIPSRSHSPNSDRLTDNASDNDGSLERKMRFSGDCGVGVCVREAFIMDNDDEDDYKSAKEESSSSNVDEDSMSGSHKSSSSDSEKRLGIGSEKSRLRKLIDSGDSDGGVNDTNQRSRSSSLDEGKPYIADQSSADSEDDEFSALPVYLPAVQGCRSVEEFHCLNRIEEGTFGVVYRARDKKTGEIVALKRLKMEKEKEGFPITSLREINTLLKAQHVNVVTVREIVVGSNMDKIYIVMDYVEHDLKSLMETMKVPFLIGEVKTLMRQLCRAVNHLHDNWILHRDLKTSNLLLSHSGILKVGDFGLAREYGSPLRQYTPIVITLWYRCPELLLGAKEYSKPVDLWSVGCIFAEFLIMKALWPGKSEIDQLQRIFKDLGTPTEKIWDGLSELSGFKKVTFPNYPYNSLRGHFGNELTDIGFDLLMKLLTYDPKRRIDARTAMDHIWYSESPKPVDPSMFPTWPARSEQVGRRHVLSPRPPSGGKAFAKMMDDEERFQVAGFHMDTSSKGTCASGAGFQLKF